MIVRPWNGDQSERLGLVGPWGFLVSLGHYTGWIESTKIEDIGAKDFTGTEMREDVRDRAVAAVAQRLESLGRAGVTHLKRVPPGASPREAPTEKGACEPSRQQDRPPVDDRAEALAALAREVAVCQRCPELARSRTQTVFGAGNPHARLVFCGEAPGADEDRQGEPFVGRAGQLLDKIINAMGLRREDVYILNILKSRPPGNRNPTPAEAANCREYLDRQLEIIQPEFICCLGAVAAQNLLDTLKPIGKLRGAFHDYHGIRVICTYHPAYLLRNPGAKRPTWEDIQMLMEAMGLER